MKELQLNISLDPRLKLVISNSLHEVISTAVGRKVTLGLEKDLGTSLESILESALKEWGPSTLKFVFDITKDGIVEVESGNLFTLLASAGYYVNPILLSKEVIQVRVNKSHLFTINKPLSIKL